MTDAINSGVNEALKEREPVAHGLAVAGSASIGGGESTAAVSWYMRPVRWLERLFSSEIRFRREGFLTVHVELEKFEKLVKEEPLSKRKVAVNAKPEDAELDLVCEVLAAILDRHHASRPVLVQLIEMENALATKGFRALAEIPLDVLFRAMVQLDSLVPDLNALGLTPLRNRVEKIISGREGDVVKGVRQDSGLSDFNVSNRMQIEESTVSNFMKVDAEWSGGSGEKPVTASDAK